MVARPPGLGRHRNRARRVRHVVGARRHGYPDPLDRSRDPLAQSRADRFLRPSLTYPFATDEFGRDILSRVIHGARIWVVGTPGPSTARLPERLDWRHRSRPFFPFDDDFEPEIRAVGPGRGGDDDGR